ncbi:MAG: hypothetical protein DPW18_13420 [Chloroflexi bacterium]|nr:hypothetical protein [Chloroflexota bacterium]MDL1943385.1 sortase [Chloroflexi bacterium CFX2]
MRANPTQSHWHPFQTEALLPASRSVPPTGGETNPNGTYATFIRFNGVDSANSATHTATGTTGECTSFPVDTFDVTDTVKDGTTTLEIGVIKINNIALRVGAISAFVTYTPFTPANDAPVITAPASISVTEDTASPLTGISFSDVDAGSASVTVMLSVPSGTLSATSGGGVTATGGGTGAVTLSGSIADINTFIAGSNVSFTTALNSTTTVTMSVDINDEGNTGTGGPQSANTTVDLIVTAVDDPPVAFDDNATVNENDPATAIDVLNNDTDVDGGTMQVASVGAASNGTTANNTTDVSYQPDAGYCGPDSFTYTLNGGSTATVNVTVNCTDDPPVAVDDTFTVPGNTTSTLDVLANDTDTDGGPMQVASVGAASNGTAVNNTTDISYTPNTDYCGPDSFTYALNGGSTATVSLTVACSPIFTSADNTAFDFGFPGTFNVTAIGNPSTMTITLTGAPAGISLTDNGDGTATLDGDGTTPAGVYPLILTANNGVPPNGIQNFTLTIRGGPTVPNINSHPNTGDGSISENESISNTLGLDKFIIDFSVDVYNPAGNNDPDDVTNPANYMLVRSVTGAFATVSCAGGVTAPDVAVSIDSVTYSNNGGSGPFVARVSINSGLPLNVDGFYRLYICGTTSIVDASNPALALAGDGANAGTDFVRNFRISPPGGGGGGGGGDDDDDEGSASNAAIAASVTQGGSPIPSTGFAPDRVTRLPAQTSTYKASGLTLEIPSLSLNMPIVGVEFNGSTWDVTWLGRNAGYLAGSAYPTWKGNTVLTGHVTDANGKPGPFAYLNEMQPGQKIHIHNNGFTYIYEVRTSGLILPSSIRTLFRHEEDSWLSLVTCENFNEETGSFANRRLIRAVLISIIPAK